MIHVHYTAKSHHLQWSLRQLFQICHHVYQPYCPVAFKHWRNANLVILIRKFQKLKKVIAAYLVSINDRPHKEVFFLMEKVLKIVSFVRCF